jgi:hypothetical protein
MLHKNAACGARKTSRIPSGIARNSAPDPGLTLAALADAVELAVEELRRYELAGVTYCGSSRSVPSEFALTWALSQYIGTYCTPRQSGIRSS